MGLQIIKDSAGQNAGVFIPMKEWEIISAKYRELEALANPGQKVKVKLSDLAGKLSKKTAQDLREHVLTSRNEWEERLTK